MDLKNDKAFEEFWINWQEKKVQELEKIVVFWMIKGKGEGYDSAYDLMTETEEWENWYEDWEEIYEEERKDKKGMTQTLQDLKKAYKKDYYDLIKWAIEDIEDDEEEIDGNIEIYREITKKDQSQIDIFINKIKKKGTLESLEGISPSWNHTHPQDNYILYGKVSKEDIDWKSTILKSLQWMEDRYPIELKNNIIISITAIEHYKPRKYRKIKPLDFKIKS